MINCFNELFGPVTGISLTQNSKKVSLHFSQMRQKKKRLKKKDGDSTTEDLAHNHRDMGLEAQISKDNRNLSSSTNPSPRSAHGSHSSTEVSECWLMC
jgi:hypothetical protein